MLNHKPQTEKERERRERAPSKLAMAVKLGCERSLKLAMGSNVILAAPSSTRLIPRQLISQTVEQMKAPEMHIASAMKSIKTRQPTHSHLFRSIRVVHLKTCVSVDESGMRHQRAPLHDVVLMS